jgi:serine phosphatase RsbU (regulator of sigma subunit)
MCLIFVSSFFIINGYFQEVKLYEKLELQKLKAITSSVALQVNGNQLEKLLNDHPWQDDIKTSYEDSNYFKIQSILSDAKNVNFLNSTLYTLSFDKDEEVFRYGVRSDSIYFRHKYELFPEILKESYETGNVISKYETENGKWISAFHPIKNSNNKTISVLQADIQLDEFNQTTWDSYSDKALISLIIIIIIALILIPYAKKILRADEEITLELIHQKREIESKNRDLTDSINYAQKIQSAFLPEIKYIKEILPNSFIVYKPKDIVSGDFYWAKKSGNKIYLACVDCTGHGIPGAFMSLIGFSMLNEIVNSKEEVKNPANILNELELKVNEALSSKQYHTQSKDGMDVGLCCFDLDKMEITYAGALRPLIIVSDNNIMEIKGDRFPIGGGSSYVKSPFKSHLISINKGDSFYMYSDGYPDQFGGPKDKKYMNKKFKSYLANQSKLTAEEQAKNLETELQSWKGKNEQVDDILIMGVFF